MLERVEKLCVLSPNRRGAHFLLVSFQRIKYNRRSKAVCKRVIAQDHFTELTRKS